MTPPSDTAPARWRDVAPAFAASRALVWLVAWTSLRWFPPRFTPGQWRAFPQYPFFDGWARWDSGWYWTIAERGYSYSPGAESNVNFFPLYPLLTKLVSLPLGWLVGASSAFHLAGMLVSNVALFVALLGLHRLACAVGGRRLARNTVWLTVMFPCSMFFSAVYSESLYLALTVWAFVFAVERRWPPAALCAGLAAVTRIVGVIAVVAVAVEYLRLKPSWRRLARDLWIALVAAAPLLALLIYFKTRFNDALVFSTTQQLWGRSFALYHLPNAVRWLMYSPVEVGARIIFTLYLVALAAVPLLGIVVYKRFGAALAVFVYGSWILAAGTGLPGTGRYIAVLFPVFMAAAAGLPRWAVVYVCVVAAPYLAFFTWEFSRWGAVN